MYVDKFMYGTCIFLTRYNKMINYVLKHLDGDFHRFVSTPLKLFQTLTKLSLGKGENLHLL